MNRAPSPLIRVALLGADATTEKLARAVVESRRFELAGYCDVDEGELTASLGALLGRVRRFDQWETLLDGQLVDAVLVARGADEDRRAEQLRKLIQASVPLVASHPVVDSMLIYYELDMIRRETGGIPLPCLPERNHPAVAQLAEMVGQGAGSPIGKVTQIVMKRSIVAPNKAQVTAQFARDVDLLRAVSGEMTRLGAMGATADDLAYEALGVQMSGPTGIVARWSVDPTPGGEGAEMELLGSSGRVSVSLPQGTANWRRVLTVGQQAETHQFDPWDPAAAALTQLAAAVDGHSLPPDWVDASRSVELAETIDRSLRKGRTIELYYEDYTEQGTFKGTMTSLGCGLLLVAMMLLGVVAIGETAGLPLMRPWPYLLLAACGVFLLLQLLMLVFRQDKGRPDPVAVPEASESVPR